MRKEVLFEINAEPYRQSIPIYGFHFGSDQRTLAIMGAMRGDEYQQMYVCARLVDQLSRMEAAGELAEGVGVLVIPSAAQFSMNTAKRFWPVDNTDINRMFPGYSLGESTQRMADHIFSALTGYEYGIQLASFYLPGNFIPHIRIMDTGYEPLAEGLKFGMPYLMIRKPRPYDTTTLNYNWQIWETKTFSLYTNATAEIDEASAEDAVQAVLRFMSANGMVTARGISSGIRTVELSEELLINVHSQTAGLLRLLRNPRDRVAQGEILAEVLDPYTTEIKEKILSPVCGTVFFTRTAQAIPAHEIILRIISERDEVQAQQQQ